MFQQVLKAITFAVGFYIFISVLAAGNVHVFKESFFTQLEFIATAIYALLEFELIKY